MAQMTFAVAAGPLAGWPSAAGLYIPVKYVPGSKGRLRCTPTSTPGHAASNCTLPPKIVHGVDQATTGMVRPEHVCCGVVFLQPQSTVLMAYQPGASGVPAFSPTVSPGCVTEPARAGAAVQSDRTPAAANFVHLLFICDSHRPPGALVWRTVPLNSPGHGKCYVRW